MCKSSTRRGHRYHQNRNSASPLLHLAWGWQGRSSRSVSSLLFLLLPPALGSGLGPRCSGVSWKEKDVPATTLGSQAKEPAIKFPDFVHTPKPVRELIKQMTLGSREWHGRKLGLFRRGAVTFSSGRTGLDGEPAASVR